MSIASNLVCLTKVSIYPCVLYRLCEVLISVNLNNWNIFLTDVFKLTVAYVFT